MIAAILGRGPSVWQTWSDSKRGAGTCVIGVNYAANVFTCDWAVSLDRHGLPGIHRLPRIGYVYDSRFHRDSGGLPRLPPEWSPLKSVDAGKEWAPRMHYSIQAALHLALALQVESVAVYGADSCWPGVNLGEPAPESEAVPGPDGPLPAGDLARWRREQRVLGRTLRIMDAHGVPVCRVQPDTDGSSDAA